MSSIFPARTPHVACRASMIHSSAEPCLRPSEAPHGHTRRDLSQPHRREVSWSWLHVRSRGEGSHRRRYPPSFWLHGVSGRSLPCCSGGLRRWSYVLIGHHARKPRRTHHTCGSAGSWEKALRGVVMFNIRGALLRLYEDF